MKHSSSLLLASAVSDELREMDPVLMDEADEADEADILRSVLQVPCELDSENARKRSALFDNRMALVLLNDANNEEYQQCRQAKSAEAQQHAQRALELLQPLESSAKDDVDATQALLTVAEFLQHAASSASWTTVCRMNELRCESAIHICRSIGEAALAINCVLVAEAYFRRAVTFLCNAGVHSLKVAHCLLDHGTALHAMGEKHAIEALRTLCAGLDIYIYARVPPDARWNEAQRLVAEIRNRETLQTEIDRIGNTVEA